MKSKRSKATDIKLSVRKAVVERDDGLCVFCGRVGNDVCHFIPRSKGGLGIEQNLAVGCRPCHMMLDQSTSRKQMLAVFREKLKEMYHDWNEEKLYYQRWQ